jgi:hypothetical protein
MEKEKLEGMLIDYIDGKLGEAERKEVERELEQSEEANTLYRQLKEVMMVLDKSPEWQPAPSLKISFEKALRREIAGAQKGSGRRIFFTPVLFYRAAAVVVLVMAGAGIGYWIHKNQQQQSELEGLRKEMESTRRIMMAMLDNRQSAGQRVLGATAAFNMETADDQIVRALVKAMNEDPNTNVRLAALEALGKFHEQEQVRKALIASLATQKDPVVQIALIQLMVRMKEKGVVKDLEKIVDDVQTIKAVKDEAYFGLMKLS